MKTIRKLDLICFGRNGAIFFNIYTMQQLGYTVTLCDNYCKIEIIIFILRACPYFLSLKMLLQEET